jgi:hypothetical protein
VLSHLEGNSDASGADGEAPARQAGLGLRGSLQRGTKAGMPNHVLCRCRDTKWRAGRDSSAASGRRATIAVFLHSPGSSRRRHRSTHMLAKAVGGPESAKREPRNSNGDPNPNIATRHLSSTQTHPPKRVVRREGAVVDGRLTRTTSTSKYKYVEHILRSIAHGRSHAELEGIVCAAAAAPRSG